MKTVLISVATFLAGVALSVLITLHRAEAARKVRRTRGTQAPREPPREHTAPRRPGRRPWEFKKKLAAWSVVVATAAGIASYVLAALDKQTASDVTVSIFTACVAYLVSYAAASTTEKVSRNRHGLDADGNPIDTQGGNDMEG